MKKTKVILLILLAVIFFSSTESFAYPRYRVCRVVHRVRPVYYYPGYVTTYYVVQKPKIIKRHHRKIVRTVIIY